MLKSEKIFDELSELLAGSYDVERNACISGRSLPLFAHSKIAMQHYAISKSWILDQFEVDDYLFCWIEKSDITKENLLQHSTWIEKYAESMVSSNNLHMRSRYIGFIFSLIESQDPKIHKYIKKSCRFRWLKWGLHGWYEIYFIVYQLPTSSWIIPGRGKEFKPLLERLKYKIERNEF